MACGVCACSTRRAASLPGEGSTHLRGCGMTAVVQVFGRRNAKIIHALWRSASEKRQGPKSRCVGHRRCSGRYGDLAAAWVSMVLSTSEAMIETEAPGYARATSVSQIIFNV